MARSSRRRPPSKTVPPPALSLTPCPPPDWRDTVRAVLTACRALSVDTTDVSMTLGDTPARCHFQLQRLLWRLHGYGDAVKLFKPVNWRTVLTNIERARALVTSAIWACSDAEAHATA